MKKIFYPFILLFCAITYSQTKVSGMVVDEKGNPIAFANVFFKDSSEGTITNDNGRFYIESATTYATLVVSFIGYATQEIDLLKKVTYDLKVTLVDGEVLDEVVVYTGKQSKKNNPAIDILRKIWEKKRTNGLKKFNQYQYDKYEKIEFDLNTIDSSFTQRKLFNGIEFIFDQVDTSNITGKTYLPIFINESFSRVNGDNKLNKTNEELLGNKNSGFESNQNIIAFVKDLYNYFDIYDNYLYFFDKNFVSPLSRTGIDTYNYVLADSSYRDNKWCYKIVYYPRRQNELTFKGDFWVNDTTFAIKEINMYASKSANINWVKEIYIEQEYEVLNDSVFLLKRDYFLSDFSLNKKEESRGVYGKRTTIYNNYKFDEEKPASFYEARTTAYDPSIYLKDDGFWEQNRPEKLSKDELGVYKMLDTLKTVPKFIRIYDLATTLASGYYEIDKLNLDYGNIFSTFGFNEVEGIRLRTGGRTYFGPNDPWRLEGYLAYGFSDKKFKYGISGKWMLDKKHRIIVAAGNRRDVEQLGVSLTATNDVLGRSFASSALFVAGNNNTLTNINLTTASVSVDPIPNFQVKTGATFKTLRSAIPEEFSLDYIDPSSPTGISSEIKQLDLNISLEYTPGRENIGYGVERNNTFNDFTRIFVNYTKGAQGFLESGFDYQKIQLYYRQPMPIGGMGTLTSTLEAGKTFGEVPLALLNVIPGNQTYFSIFNTFPNLNFYEFVTDTYVTLHLEHNFNGRLFSRIPFLKKSDLREIVGIRGAWGSISDANVALSQPSNIPLIAPDGQVYWEYSFGVGNIFKVFRIDFNFRGNYLDLPDARPFSVTGSFGFFF